VNKAAEESKQHVANSIAGKKSLSCATWLYVPSRAITKN